MSLLSNLRAPALVVACVLPACVLPACVFEPVDLRLKRDIDKGHPCQDSDTCVGPPGFCISDSEVPERVVLEGAFQKGPSIAPTRIGVIALDEQLRSRGQVIASETRGLGDFSLPLNDRGLCAIRVEGAFYNEVTGSLSDGQLELRGLYATDGELTQSRQATAMHVSQPASGAVSRPGPAGAPAGAARRRGPGRRPRARPRRPGRRSATRRSCCRRRRGSGRRHRRRGRRESC